MILYKEEMKKILFRVIGSSSSNRKGGKGAIVVRAKNAKVCFVFGV